MTDHTSRLCQIQKQTDRIRNLCILAHVDHGKTTFADALIASNGIISNRLAGKIHYMDYREDEQLRQITMKSSAITLHYSIPVLNSDKFESYLINLIDSPGHVDFASEVSTAVRLCDGAFLIVDSIEGVCPQTRAVIRQACLEQVTPCLVLNKIDKLITELKKTPLEAYYHLVQILEQVNALMASYYTMSLLEPEASSPFGASPSKESDDDEFDSMDSHKIFFSPVKGNVIFASSLDGWAFNLDSFVEIFSKKLGYSKKALRCTLWGDYYLHSKQQRIFQNAQAKNKKPLFVQFILDNIWSVYENVLIIKDKTKIEKIINSLKINIHPRDLKHPDPRVHLHAIFRAWLPLPDVALKMAVNHLPSPCDISAEKIERLFRTHAHDKFESLPAETQSLKHFFLKCECSPEAPTIAFISKMMTLPVNKSVYSSSNQLTEMSIEERKARLQSIKLSNMHTDNTTTISELNTNETKNNNKVDLTTTITKSDVADPTLNTNTIINPTEGLDQIGVALPIVTPPLDSENIMINENTICDELVIALARIYSGSLYIGQKIYILHPRYNIASYQPHTAADTPTDNPENTSVVTIDSLYLLMGKEAIPVDSVPAGNIVGIGGLNSVVFKSATLSSTLACPPFTPLYLDSTPILKVAIEPKSIGDIKRLTDGVKMLEMVDPCLEVSLEDTGEQIIACSGEVHLKKVIEDLRNMFAKGIEFDISPTIIPYRETIVKPPSVDMVNEKIDTSKLPEDKLIINNTANNLCELRVRALPLSTEIINLLESKHHLIRIINSHQQRSEAKMYVDTHQSILSEISAFKEELTKLFLIENKECIGFINNLWAFGPKNNGPNILINNIPDYARISVWPRDYSISDTSTKLSLRDFDHSVIQGFQLACAQGPLCAEPMHGVCFILERWNIHQPQETQEATENNDTTSAEELNADPLPVGATKQIVIPFGPFSGQIISTMTKTCRQAVLAQPTRLMLAMYLCYMQCTQEVMSKLYGVIHRRGGRFLEQQMQVGTNLFLMEAVLPVAESFGFSDEIRKKTSGLAVPYLMFSHWEALNFDPFWVPTTEEELLHYGVTADSENIARKYINSVRKRKGLPVDEKVVDSAEKQRTIKK